MKASQSKNALMINAQNPLIFVIPYRFCSDEKYQTQAKYHKSPQQS